MPAIQTYPRTTNVLIIDDQHGYFYDCIESLEAAMASGKGAAAIPALLRELASFAEMHFAMEERLMQSFRYSLRDMHALEHRKALLKLEDIVAHQLDSKTIAVKILEELH